MSANCAAKWRTTSMAAMNNANVTARPQLTAGSFFIDKRYNKDEG